MKNGRVEIRLVGYPIDVTVITLAEDLSPVLRHQMVCCADQREAVNSIPGPDHRDSQPQIILCGINWNIRGNVRWETSGALVNGPPRWIFIEYIDPWKVNIWAFQYRMLGGENMIPPAIERLPVHRYDHTRDAYRPTRLRGGTLQPKWEYIS